MKKIIKKIIYVIIGGIVFLIVIPLLYHLTSFIFIVCGGVLCNPSSNLDWNKIDTAFFVGEYQTNYRNEIEKITLKENGWYDYAYGKDNDTIIKDVGKWGFDKEWQFVYIDHFPNIRKNKVYEEEKKIFFNMQLNIDGSTSGLGDLYMIDSEENRYTFVKLDKSKNKNYITR